MVENAAHDFVIGPYEGPAAVRDADFLERGPNALHQALQIAVADALRERAHVVLVFTPGLLERRDALAVFVETLELVEGLRAAGRLDYPAGPRGISPVRSTAPVPRAGCTGRRPGPSRAGR